MWLVLSSRASHSVPQDHGWREPLIHALSVVANAQSKLVMVITDFNFYLLRLGVMESVAQRFGSDFVDFVTEDGMEISRLALNRYAEGCRSMIA